MATFCKQLLLAHLLAWHPACAVRDVVQELGGAFGHLDASEAAAVAGVDAGDEHSSLTGAQGDLGIDSVTEVGDDIQLGISPPSEDVTAPGLGYKVALKRRFLGSDRGNECEKVPVGSCASTTPGLPCFTPTDSGVLLKNLVLASAYEVHVATSTGATATRLVKTRAKAGVPREVCGVNWWSCETEKETKDKYPGKGSPLCSLTAPPVPACSKVKHSSCDGKKSFHRCQPIMEAGAPSCVGDLNLRGVCEWTAPPPQGKKKAPAKCQEAGCSGGVMGFFAESCCCLPRTENTEDSPTCACASDKCAKLGLVEALNPRFCRH